MGTVVSFRHKDRPSVGTEATLSKLQEQGMAADAVVICSKLLAEFDRTGLPKPSIRGGLNMGFLLFWDTPEVGVAIEAPGQGGHLWSIHRHDRKEALQPCYEIRFEFNGNIAEIAEAVREALRK